MQLLTSKKLKTYLSLSVGATAAGGTTLAEAAARTNFMVRHALMLALALLSAPLDAKADVIYVSLQNGTVQSFDVSLGSAAAIALSAQTFTSQALTRPQGVAFNATGDLFVASYDTSTIAKYAPNGSYLPGGSISTNLQNPFGIAFDASGRLFAVNNGGGGSVSIFDAAGTYQGSISSNLNSPTGVTVDASGNLYVANSGDNTISKFDAAGNYLAAGSIAGNLDAPFGLARDASGNLYAANVNNNTISKFDASGSFVSTLGSGSLSVPVGLAIDSSGNLYAANYNGNTIAKFSAAGTFLLSWSTADAPRFLAVAPVPEPSTWMLATIAAVVLAGACRLSTKPDLER